MSDFMTDLSGILTDKVIQATTAKNSTNTKAGSELETMDFLQLMVAGFQNQSIDDVASTSEMMNQMMQMSVIQAVNSLTNLINQSTSLSYAASLVGKEVTIGQFNGSELQEIVGVVTGTGTVSGQQVVFVNGESYYMSDILAVGRLPGQEAQEAESEEDGDPLLNLAGEEDPYSDIYWPSEHQDEEKEAAAENAEIVSSHAERLEAEADAADQKVNEYIQNTWQGDTGISQTLNPTAEMMQAAAENLYDDSL